MELTESEKTPIARFIKVAPAPMLTIIIILALPSVRFGLWPRLRIQTLIFICRTWPRLKILKTAAPLILTLTTVMTLIPINRTWSCWRLPCLIRSWPTLNSNSSATDSELLGVIQRYWRLLSKLDLTSVWPKKSKSAGMSMGMKWSWNRLGMELEKTWKWLWLLIKRSWPGFKK